jgi:hypothetical protein
MGSVIVVECELGSQAVDAAKDVLVFLEINFFVFDRASPPFHKDIVKDSDTLPIHPGKLQVVTWAQDAVCWKNQWR